MAVHDVHIGLIDGATPSDGDHAAVKRRPGELHRDRRVASIPDLRGTEYRSVDRGVRLGGEHVATDAAAQPRARHLRRVFRL